MIAITSHTIYARITGLLTLLGLLRPRRSTTMDNYGAQYDSESRIDADNQIIDDIEDDRW